MARGILSAIPTQAVGGAAAAEVWAAVVEVVSSAAAVTVAC